MSDSQFGDIFGDGREDDYSLPEDAPAEPERLSDGPAWNRRIRKTDADDKLKSTDLVPRPLVSLDEARAMIETRIAEYLATENPMSMLLVKAEPGTGKTTLAVAAAERFAADPRKLVLYAAPRHRFFADVMALAGRPEWWIEWLPRLEGKNDSGADRTCQWVPQITSWMARGYESMPFCAGVCGWTYIRSACVYHKQKALLTPWENGHQRRARIVMGQHQHVSTGHPLTFSLLIGDESPLTTFTHEWLIPGRYIKPKRIDDTEPFAEMLFNLQDLADQGLTLFGRALIDSLGGVEYVKSVVTGDIQLPSPMEIHQADEVGGADYMHGPKLARLLAREVIEAEAGRDYLERVVITGGNLLLLLRKRVNPEMPRHVVWLDATGNKHLYERMFQRAVEVVEPNVKPVGRVFQVVDRANGKGSLVKDGETTDKAGQLKLQADAIRARYQTVGVITHMAVEHLFEDYADRGHFYGERGTNRFGHVDALIVAGVPQTTLVDIEKLGKMIYFERMESFRVGGKLPWSTAYQSYNYRDADGRGRQYPAGGFWGEANEDLQALLHQTREAEIVQAVHRARPNIRPVDVWLLSNLPIAEVPLADEPMPMRDLFGAPEGVDIFTWPKVAAVAAVAWDEGRPLTTVEIVSGTGCDPHTARNYLEKLVTTDRWMWPPADMIVPRGRGRPVKAIYPARSE